MIDLGEIEEEEAKGHPERNIITRCIGIECLPPDAYVIKAPVSPGETYLLCSDGLWEYIADEGMEAIISSEADLKEKAVQLLNTALKNGFDDSISICLCRSFE